MGLSPTICFTFQYLGSLSKISSPNILRFIQLQMRTWQYAEKAIVHWSLVVPCGVYQGGMLSWASVRVFKCTGFNNTFENKYHIRAEYYCNNLCNPPDMWYHHHYVYHMISFSTFQISQACQVCQQQPRLFQSHSAQIHTLLVSIIQHLEHFLEPSYDPHRASSGLAVLLDTIFHSLLLKMTTLHIGCWCFSGRHTRTFFIWMITWGGTLEQLKQLEVVWAVDVDWVLRKLKNKLWAFWLQHLVPYYDTVTVNSLVFAGINVAFLKRNHTRRD